MNTQCIVYVSDVEYSFPTFLSAIQARKFANSKTDVCVLMSEKIDNFKDLQALLQEKGVELVDAADALTDCLGHLNGEHFQGRISVSTMAKLVLCEVLPKHYTQIIYFDGDTQIVSSLYALESTFVPQGRFFAARDYMSIRKMLLGGADSHYFNAGVLKFHRDGWIGQEALALFASNPDACEGKHDQGALNYVCGRSLTLISNRWNFPKQFLHLVDMSSLALVHYMAHPKPWHGTFFPWTEKESRVYVELRKAHPLFDALYRGISLDRTLMYKYRSVREKIGHTFSSAVPNPHVQGLLVGNYAV
ncbi:glycosyltransferase [Agrobacterium sp.]|uniref:glycosyltransferase family 8 protein n=1 Tax=Agrobacterium sp. TaxID=361 RepID=UPI0028A6D0CA|nr:glycosyltransferase [Agrobacterium sp.]